MQHSPVKGQYVVAHHFFGKNVRGTFAHYRRQTSEQPVAFKQCLRIEVLRTGKQEPKEGIATEVTIEAIAGFLAVIRRNSARYSYSIRRPTHADKYVNLFFNDGAELPYVLNMVDGDLKLSCPFSKEDAWHFSMIASSVMVGLYPNVQPQLGLHFMKELGLGT